MRRLPQLVSSCPVQTAEALVPEKVEESAREEWDELLELRFGHQADRQLKRHLVAFRQAADARPLVVTQPMKLRLRGLHLALCGTDLLQRPLHRLQHGVLLTAHLHQERGAVGRELRSLPARLLRGDELRRHAAQ